MIAQLELLFVWDFYFFVLLCLFDGLFSEIRNQQKSWLNSQEFLLFRGGGVFLPL